MRDETKRLDRMDRVLGCLLGLAVGDAIGLPNEGMSRRRTQAMLGEGPLRHRFVLGRGMCSDDAEHALMTGQALLACGGDERRFARSLAWRLRWWLLGAPAGIGRATLRAILRLWIGVPPDRSGVRSAGNGAAMRAPILGVCLAHDLDRARTFTLASTRITHRDPQAEQGALAIARAAAYAIRTAGEPLEWRPALAFVREATDDAELAAAVGRIEQHLAAGDSLTEFADVLGLARGVSGYVVHTVPIVLYAWLRSDGDYARAIEEVVRLGGDTDTTAAITGGLIGASYGEQAIPQRWLAGICEWPRTIRWMRGVGRRLAALDDAESWSAVPAPLFWPGLIVRNALFLALVLLYALRRLAPPYG